MAILVPSESYCKWEDVKGDKLPHRTLTADSRPTITKAEDIIKRTADQLNAILRGLGYSTPLTTAGDINLMKEIQMLGSAYKIESAALAQLPNPNFALLDRLKEDWEDELKRLQDGEYVFEGAGAPPTAEMEGNADLADGGDNDEPLFKKELVGVDGAGDDF